MGSMIRSASLMEFLMMVAIPVFMVGIAVFVGLRARRRAALIKATPTSNIGMATDGYREFEGMIEAIDGKLLTSPLTRSPCVWYHAKVEESVSSRQTTGNAGRHWRVVNETSSSAPFLVRDATGGCVVYPNDADVTPTDKSLWYGATIKPEDTNPAKVKPGESARPKLEVLSGPNSKFRYSEERIYAGNPLLVLGEFTDGLAIPQPVIVDEEVADEEDPNEEELALQAAAGTKASIRAGTGDGPPFILTTTPQEAHVAAMSKGGSAALGIAVLPLAIAALLVWLRFS
jgi:hypothetical protein